MSTGQWSRRDVLKAAGATAALSAFSASGWSSTTRGRLVYAATDWTAGEPAGIRVCAHERELSFHPSPRPSALALNNAGDRLYVANCVGAFQGMPCGSVETYRVERASGKLHLLRTTPLALASTHPDGIAVSPDGSLLLAVSSSRGILNVLPLDAEGCAGPVTAARKEMIAAPPSSTFAQDLPQVKFLREDVCAVGYPVRGQRVLYSCNREGIAVVGREGWAQSGDLQLPPVSIARSLAFVLG